MRNTSRILFVAALIVSVFIMRPLSSYADWHGHDSGHRHDYGHHDHGYTGVNFSVWPQNYYYYDAPYYSDEVLISPAVYQQPVEVIQPPTVIDSGAQVIAPAIATQAVTNEIPDSITINIPNDQGSYTAVTLKKSGNGFIGPQGEFYPEFPKVSQLKVIYGK